MTFGTPISRGKSWNISFTRSTWCCLPLSSQAAGTRRCKSTLSLQLSGPSTCFLTSLLQLLNELTRILRHPEVSLLPYPYFLNSEENTDRAHCCI